MSYVRASLAVVTAALVTLTVSGCSNANEKKYDISPVFPLSANKCEKYNGDAEHTGILDHCWVTLDECRRAAADWAAEMKKGHVDNAIRFTCD